MNNLFYNLSEELRYVAEDYCNNQESYTQEFHVTINGKLRHIITYAQGENGSKLRYLHHCIRRSLSGHYSSSSHSYAYKKNYSIRKCVECHLDSCSFLKADIHGYFDSIDYDILLKRMQKLSVCRDHPVETETLLKACFYKNSLPIGFITSPVLSDIYLTSLDRKLSKIKDIVYSRYADDFIISSCDANSKNLDNVLKILSDELSKYKLQLNMDKTYIRTLSHSGDAIHVLGINIVKNDFYPNSITISDRYLREICMECGNALSKKEKESETIDDDMYLKRISGKINFVRDISDRSYDKLRKLVLIKCGDSAVEKFFT